jgi:DNA-binding transcriptional regulator YiaG
MSETKQRSIKGGLALRGWESTRGENSRTAKLNETKVRFIRKSEESSQSLAAMFGVSVKCIREVRMRRKWRHVTDEE